MKIAKKALSIINKKLMKKELDYQKEYLSLANALSKLEAYEDLDKTPKELFCIIHNIKLNNIPVSEDYNFEIGM